MKKLYRNVAILVTIVLLIASSAIILGLDSEADVDGDLVIPVDPDTGDPVIPTEPGTGYVYQPYDDDSPNIQFSTTGQFRLLDAQGNVVKYYIFSATVKSYAVTTWEFDLTTTLKSDRLDFNTAFFTYEVRVYKGDFIFGLLLTKSSFPPKVDIGNQEHMVLSGSMVGAINSLEAQGVSFDQPTKITFDCVVKHKTKHAAGFWAEEWLGAGAVCTVHKDAAGIIYLDDPF